MISNIPPAGAIDWEVVIQQLMDPTRLRRFIGLGARAEDLFSAYGRIGALSDWGPEFGKLAAQYESAGDACADTPPGLAGWMDAALYYHIASLGIFADNDERKSLYDSVVRCYRKAAPHFRVPAEVVEYEFSGVPFSAYFRRSPSGTDCPTIVLVRGQDATRELELHTISDFLLDRGFNTLAIDAAGQGESRRHGMRLPERLVESVAAAVDCLRDSRGIDVSALGILGQSFGGHLAVRIAAGEPRFRACAILAGFYSLTDFRRTPLARHNFMLNMGSREYAEKAEPLFTLEGIVEKMQCPILAVNGALDQVMPPSQILKIYERAQQSRHRSFKLYEGLGHCAYYDNRAVLYDVANWFLEKLI